MTAEPLEEIPEGAHAAYDGRICLGWVFRRGSAFLALKHDRTILGTFSSELAAKNALWCEGADS